MVARQPLPSGAQLRLQKAAAVRFTTQLWSNWFRAEDGTVGYPVWSQDGKSMDLERFFGNEPSMHKLRLGESRSERFLPWNNLHRFGGVWGTWSVRDV
jgi:hypothetical protein